MSDQPEGSGDSTLGEAMRRGLLLILSSPSGAGKSTLSRKLMAWDPTMRFSISATTRPPRPGEVHGQDYTFMERPEFEALVQAGGMLEYAEVFGNFYGSPRAPVEGAMAAGCDTLFDIDWQGGQQINNSPLQRDVISIFILPPSIAALESRLHQRAQDSDAVIAERMAQNREEISHWAEYDYVVINENLDEAFAQICTIIEAERLRRVRQPSLPLFIRQLNEEFAQR